MVPRLPVLRMLWLQIQLYVVQSMDLVMSKIFVMVSLLIALLTISAMLDIHAGLHQIFVMPLNSAMEPPATAHVMRKCQLGLFAVIQQV